MKYKVVLASGSPRRREMLERFGVDFKIIKSEEEEYTEETIPWEIVKELSCNKAREVFYKLDDKSGICVIAADTVVAVDGAVLGKPVDEADAFNMLKKLSGRSHQVYTGVTVVTESELICFYDMTEVFVNALSDEEIKAYISTGEPMDKAGAYGIQGLFGIHIDRINGSYDNVVGLPISRLYTETRKAGIEIF